LKLAGKIALVTGAQQGIGAAVVTEMAKEGADIALNWLDDERAANELAEQVKAEGRRVHLIRADVARLDEIRDMVVSTTRALGVPDILVNNAGVFPRVSLLELTEAEWDFVLDVNLKAVCFAAIEVAKAIIAAGKTHGAIVNLSSQVLRGAVRSVHYAASKGGVVSLTRALALELAPYNIRVNAVAPGLTDTAQPRLGNSEQQLLDRAKSEIPLGGRLLTPRQIARTIVFLASDDADATTGQTLHVNGGSFMP
jgi:NAD(P)-dependent dehydrogenase (short-subunit alcohol dehydrogenase family)